MKRNTLCEEIREISDRLLELAARVDGHPVLRNMGREDVASDLIAEPTPKRLPYAAKVSWAQPKALKPPEPTVSPEPQASSLPKPQRYLTAEEAIQFLGLRSKSALFYLHNQPDGPPFVRLTARRRVYCLADLIAWSEARKTAIR